MRIQMAFLICLSLAALTLGLIAASGGVVVQERPPSAGFPSATSESPYERGIAGRSIGVECGRPHELRLVRFEDGSAQLKCAERILARVSVPQH
jgi:hypothetical protein